MKKHLIAVLILIAYCAILVKVMVLKDLPLIRIGPLMLNFGGTQEGAANLIPFKTILPYLLGEKGFLIGAINLLGNIVLLVPIGFLLPFVFPAARWKKIFVLAIATGLAIEGMQVLLHVGIFDIDDVILNALGVMIGYWSFVILASWVRSKKYKYMIIAAVIVIVASLAMLYAIYPKDQQRVNDVLVVEQEPHDHIDSIKTGTQGTVAPQGKDPCNSTGGTGQIVSVGEKTITIKRGDGVNQAIKLTGRTKIENSMGAVSESDLKIGDRVTLVIDDSETAALVLVCNTGNTGGRK